MGPISTERYKGFKIELHQDEMNDSPRDWDNLGTMVCFNKRYTLGDQHTFSDPEELQKFLNRGDLIFMPLYLYDHGGITMRTRPFDSRWDSGQVGFIYCLYETIQKEFGLVNQITKAKARKLLTSEVEVYDDYLTGNVFGYKVINANGEEVDSCWGYYGDPDKEGGAITAAKEWIDGKIGDEHESKPSMILSTAPALAG